MYRFGWAVRSLSPRRTLTTWAGVVAVIMVAQLALVIAGSLSAKAEANRALDGSFVFLADVSQERVLAYSQAAEQSLVELSGQLSGDVRDAPLVLDRLHAKLAATRELGAVDVTYENGDYVALRRVPGPQGGFSAYMISRDPNGLTTHKTVEYNSSMVKQSTQTHPLSLDPKDSSRYRAAVEARAQGSVWSEPEMDPWTGTTEVWSSRADVARGGEVVVVSASLMLPELSLRLNDLPAGSDGEVSLLSANRQVITARPGSDVGSLTEEAAAAATATTHPATPATDGDVWGADGNFRTLERGLGPEGVDWVVHLRASTAGFNQGFAQVREIFRGVLLGTGFLTLVLGFILFRLWRPVSVMRDDVERDTLTGLRNRRDFDTAVERTLRLAERVGGSVAVVMLDVDHFKRINDGLGHAAGDRALKSLGRALSYAVRSGDTAMRWGGDEFVLVLLLAESDDATAHVEGIRVRLEQSLLRVAPDIDGLGVTAGYTLCSRPGTDADVLVAQADGALVEGKLVRKGVTYAADSL